VSAPDATLASALALDSQLVTALRNTEALAEDDPDERPWVYAVPAEFVDHLTQVKQSAVPDIAQGWIASDKVIAVVKRLPSEKPGHIGRRSERSFRVPRPAREVSC
jgi:hypothetical protein